MVTSPNEMEADCNFRGMVPPSLGTKCPKDNREGPYRQLSGLNGTVPTSYRDHVLGTTRLAAIFGFAYLRITTNRALRLASDLLRYLNAMAKLGQLVAFS
jgi:hypothetical protein